MTHDYIDRDAIPYVAANDGTIYVAFKKYIDIVPAADVVSRAEYNEAYERGYQTGKSEAVDKVFVEIWDLLVDHTTIHGKIDFSFIREYADLKKKYKTED